MSDPKSVSEFKCPACRARQSLQDACRRCGADLTLVVAALRRIAFLQQRLNQSAAGSVHQRRIISELQRLSPNRIPFTNTD